MLLHNLLLLAAPAFGGATQDDDFETRLEEYEEERERVALVLRTRGRQQLSESGDERALEILIKDYEKPERPEEFVRSTIVEMARRDFSQTGWHQAWRAWREDQDDATDAWLWFNSLELEGRADPAAWTEAAQGKADAPLRAAALLAGAKLAGDDELEPEHLAVLQAVLDDLPKKGLERAVLLEAVLATIAGAEPSDDYDAVLNAAVDALPKKGSKDRSAVFLPRLLSRALGCKNIGVRPGGWRELIARPVEERDRPVPPKYLLALDHGFFGLQDHGRRICYVIDASDSMLKPLTQRERSELQPMTGENGPERPADSRARRMELTIDWSKIETRFDAARAMLKLALADLNPSDSFAVVLFGDYAETLRATRRLELAKDKTIEDVFEELDRIQVGQPTPERPDGTLYGKTNLHGGLRLAFRLTESKKNVKENADVDEAGFDSGCDTIFLLSDGAPNWDDFEANDVNESGVVGDPEAGTATGRSNMALFAGPFAQRRYLISDLERLAFLRRPTIHAVGMGEADTRLLQRIAGIGGGELLMVGQR